jgi:hypothetical protein
VLAAKFIAARRGKDDYGRAREMEKSRVRNDFWLKTLSTFISIFSVPFSPSAGIMLAFVSYGNWATEFSGIMTAKEGKSSGGANTSAKLSWIRKHKRIGHHLYNMVLL